MQENQKKKIIAFEKYFVDNQLVTHKSPTLVCSSVGHMKNTMKIKLFQLFRSIFRENPVCEDANQDNGSYP